MVGSNPLRTAELVAEVAMKPMEEAPPVGQPELPAPYAYGLAYVMDSAYSACCGTHSGDTHGHYQWAYLCRGWANGPYAGTEPVVDLQGPFAEMGPAVVLRHGPWCSVASPGASCSLVSVVGDGPSLAKALSGDGQANPDGPSAASATLPSFF